MIQRPKRSFLYIFNFFTTWSVILALLHSYTHKYINLLFVSFVTFIAGLYLSFINPRRFVFYFDKERYEYTGVQKFIIVDMLFHLLVFYLIWEKYGNFYSQTDPLVCTKTWTAMVIMGAYAMLYPLKKIYGIPVQELLLVCTIAILLYFIIFHQKSIYT